MSGAAGLGPISRHPGGGDGPDVAGFVGTRWIALLTLANLGLWMALFTPVQVLLPDQVAGIDESHKVTALGIVSAIGGAIALVGSPLAGALSDRTASRYGRRHPWTLGGALLAAGALFALAEQHTIVGVAVCWGIAQLGMNAVLASLTAAVPDHVPVPQRGTVSGWIGLPQCIGVVVGTVLVTTAFTGQRGGYAVIAVAFVVLVLPFVLGTDDPPHPRAEREAPGWSAFATGAWSALRDHPDLAWALGTRFLVMLGNALGTMYLLYFLDDEVGVDDPDLGLLVLVLVYSLGVLCSAVPGGIASDRAGRRKPFVIWSGVTMALAAALLAVVPTMPAAIVAAALLGLGYGLYLAVDSALVTQVLPYPESYARDLGVLNIAGAAPLVLAPALAALVVNELGGYAVLYLLTAAVTLAGGLLVTRIRSVP